MCPLFTLSSALENNKPVKEFFTHNETNSGYVFIELALDIINLENILCLLIVDLCGKVFGNNQYSFMYYGCLSFYMKKGLF